MKHQILSALLPPLALGVILSLLFLIPIEGELQPAAISPDLPTYYELTGWYGTRIQESPLEREVLASDTRFSKALYLKTRQSLDEPKGPQICVSIVFSGNDMNSSIHRPERCLPAQGHLDLQGCDSNISLTNGRTITFHRLSSRTITGSKPTCTLHHINYYIFIGHDSLHHTHLSRTFQDMYDRVAKGITQHWAYFQVGTYWGDELGISEQQADEQLRQLISQLLPILIDWEALDTNPPSPKTIR